ncbi:MAG: hypothetical protein ACI837_002841 [Crocinitomicaceae bacterium]|jgi:hypothetical protein
MKKQFYILLLFIFLSKVSVAQRVHLEVGGTIGFKDEFHATPSFDTTSRYTEFHIYDLTLFTRVSKRNLGSEIGIGFEKAGNYFLRRFDNSTEAKFMQLNRVYIDVSPYIYLIKNPKIKWDLQVGFRNYFNLTRSMQIPEEQLQKSWKLAGRITTNYTFKSFLIGIYYEHDLRADYFFPPNNATFGIRCGVVF